MSELLPWLGPRLCSIWGARLDAFVLDNLELSDYIKKQYVCTPILVNDAVKLGPHGPWLGIVFATLSSATDAEVFRSLFDAGGILGLKC